MGDKLSSDDIFVKIKIYDFKDIENNNKLRILIVAKTVRRLSISNTSQTDDIRNQGCRIKIIVSAVCPTRVVEISMTMVQLARILELRISET